MSRATKRQRSGAATTRIIKVKSNDEAENTRPTESAEGEGSHDQGDVQSVDETSKTQASFNGQLQNYAYTSTTTTTTTTPTNTPPAAKALRTMRRTTTAKSIPSSPRSPKRKLSDTDTSTTVPSPSPSKKPKPPSKKTRSASRYAPPTTYAHITNLLEDVLAPNLLVLFIGVNPGLRTATTGHAYSHPSNLFWRLLHSSGITPDRRVSPTEDRELPRLYGCGNTNIVARTTRDQGELGKGEMDEGVAVLEEKVRKWRPEAVCVVGKGIWESVWRVRRGRGIRKDEFRWGWQGEEENMGRVDGRGMRAGEVGDGVWKGARVFVATSTSGLAASLRPHEKEAIWKPLGEWVQKRRRERADVDV